MSKNKPFHTLKSQVTAFILVGILIIAIVWGSLYISEYFAKKDMEKFAPAGHQLTLESDTIKENIDTCVQSLTDKGMQLMSDQGLHLDIPENHTYNNYSYWLKNTINIMPSSFEKIEQDLAYYINTNLYNCANLDEFKENGWDISPFNPSTTAKIQEQDIGVEVKYAINVKKQDFEREFSNSIYNPKIRFRQMYSKSVDFMNNQLLKPDFDFNNPLEGYNTTGYTINHEKLDNQTLLFSIIDSQSKILDGKPFTLTFVADFSTNNVIRNYDISNYQDYRAVFSPDRLAVLILEPETIQSNDTITITQYKTDSVTRENTPAEKIKTTITQTKDIVFNTAYPIYRFGSAETMFSNPVILRIYLNKDQRHVPDDFSLLYNGKNGWLPYPNEINSSAGYIDSLIYGFSEYTPIDCSAMPVQEYPGPKAEEDRGFWGAWGPIIIAIAAIVAIALAIHFLPGLLNPLSKGGNIIFPHAVYEPPQEENSSNSQSGLASTSNMLLGNNLAYELLSKYPSIADLNSLALAAYESYTLWGEAANAKNTMLITALCDNQIIIDPKEKDGDCDCFVTDMETGESKKSKSYDVKKGKAYTITAAVTDFDAFEEKASCQCNIKGLVVTVSDTSYEEEILPAPVSPIKNTKPFLSCCITKDNYCLDNYLTDICDGKTIEKTCNEIKECAKPLPLSGEGILRTTNQNTRSNFGAEGENFLITYYLPSADQNTQVIVHIKADNQLIESINLYDNGMHKDGLRNDKYYASTWNTLKVLQNSNTKKVTADIEVIYTDSQTTLPNVGSLMILNKNIDCNPMGVLSFNNDLDIRFAANHYNDFNKYSQNAERTASKILLTTPFTQYYRNKGINFYKSNKLFDTTDTTQINNYLDNQCSYSNSPKKLTISLNDNAVECNQKDSVVELNPLITFKSEISNTNIDLVLSDFCSYVNNIIFLNPPKPEIITQNTTTIPGNVDVEFKIIDEEYPVNYELLWNHMHQVQDQVHDNSPKTHTLNLPNGEWIFQIKATDKQGMIGYSNTISITIEDNNGGEIE
ncbi:hypothetical protein CEE44_04130 [Candidatus Woesearchaeota archaeon B3_Woes]|nr:MAG: hypothetical protein CEE44_04130 [Candidatus Woesearchaeota archaeon B3_Woes]